MAAQRKRVRLGVLVGVTTLVAVGGVWVAGATPFEAMESAAAAAAPGEPLAPLSAAEIDTAVRVIEAYHAFPEGAVFPTVTLKEPPKSEVLAWAPGQAFRREAFANVYDRDANKLFEAVVDLKAERVASWVARPGRQPAVFDTEWGDVDTIVRGDSRWRAAMQRRGVKPADVYIDVWAPGELPESDSKAPPGTRLMRAISFYRGDLPNPYTRPIEGVVATVDMNRMRVVDVIDDKVRPVNKTITGNAGSPRGGLEPLRVQQPNGPSFDIDGRKVDWQKWQFRVGFSQREGLILHQIGYRDGGAVRPIIHRVSLSEIFVPYASPDRTWAWRAAFDVGEYNLGQFSEELMKNVDVPENAVFFDADVPSDTGSADGAFPLSHVVAIYERDNGSLWDRTDPETFERDARLARELVVTTAMAIGNYTYNHSYVFRQDGSIDVRVGATGTLLTQGVATHDEGDAFGETVAQNIAAPSHQHFFNFRIDFDVDGPTNQVVEENTEAVASAPGNGFVNRHTVLANEGARDWSPLTDRTWIVESSTRTNSVGHPTGYAVKPRENTRVYAASSFEAAPDFARHALWVTRHHDGELYAGGDYPFQGGIGEGVPDYAAPAESIRNRDVVVWYTTAMTHHPHAEEFPVMPAESIGFSLRPHSFFSENPALDVPKQ